jgi:hypothetical protein
VVSGSSYAFRVASKIAKVILSARNARLSGFSLIRSISAIEPTMIPAWIPPSSLSPENVTTSAPWSRTSRGVGSWGNPKRARSNKAPLPMSSFT